MTKSSPSRGRGGGRVVATVLVLALVLAAVPACSSSSSSFSSPGNDQDGPNPPKPKLKLTPWQKAMENVSEKTGRRSKQAALVLFEMTFGDVPGVKTPENRGPVPEGTPAVRAVMAHFDEYSPEQQRAIRRLLASPPGSVTFTLTPDDQAPSTIPPDAQPTTPDDQPPPANAPEMQPIAYVQNQNPEQLEASAKELLAPFRQQFAARLGSDIPEPKITILPAGTRLPKQPKALAWTGPVSPGSAACEMKFPADIFATTYRAGDVAHELFHCFQLAIAPAQYGPSPDWMIEGSAAYAQQDVAGPDPRPDWWPQYTTKPNADFFTRSYSAVGFFAHLAETGTDPYQVLPTMLRDGTSRGAFRASGATRDAFLDSWASGYFRGDIKGQAWTMTGPGLSYFEDKAVPTRMTIDGDGTVNEREVERYRNEIWRLRVNADAIEVEAGEGSHVRISDGRADVIVRGTQEFCVRPQGCVCPRDQKQQAPPPLLPDVALAVTGGTAGSEVTVTGSSLKNLEDLCCSPKGRRSTVDGVTIKPVVNCGVIGLRMGRAGGLRFDIGYELLVDRPRLRPVFTSSKGKKSRKVAGVDLEGIKGIQIDFAAGAVNGSADNQTLEFDVPSDLEVPVRPRAPGLPRTMKLHWKVAIKTGITGNNSSFHAQGRFGIGGPLGVQGGTVLKPPVTTETNPVNNMTGITLGPSAIVIAVSTKFTAGAGTPRPAKGTFSALDAGFTATQGSVLGSPLLVCRQVSLAVFFSAGGGGLGRVKKKVFDGKSSVPDFNICGGR